MQQGDAFAFPLTIAAADGTIITPDNCADVKVLIKGLTAKSYVAETLIPETDDGAYTGRWLYPLTQANTLTLSGSVPVQAQVKFADGTILGTQVMFAPVLESIITTAWE